MSKDNKFDQIRNHYFNTNLSITQFREQFYEMYGYKNAEVMKTLMIANGITKPAKDEWIKQKNNINYGVIKEFDIAKVKNFGFERSLGEEYRSYRLPEEFKKIGIISDVHYPFHDLEALTLAIQYLLDQEIDCLYLNGDIFDFYSISRHEKDPDLRDFKREVDMCRSFLQKLRDLFPTQLICFKVGNHEERWAKSLSVNVEEFSRIEDLMFEKFFWIDKLGFQYVEGWQGCEMGDLLVVHGHEMYGSGGINPANSLMNKTYCNALMGHVHRTSNQMKKNGFKNFINTYSTGCLTMLSPRYMPFSMHNHGFAIVEIDDQGKSKVKNILIKDYKVLD